MKTVVVTFTTAGARIVKGVDPAAFPGALVNPQIPRGVPPHLWVKDGDKIGVITQAEWERRQGLEKPKPRLKIRWDLIVTATLAFAAGVAVSCG